MDRDLFFLFVVFIILNHLIPRYSIMQWTDRIQQTKILLVVAAIVIAAASLVVSHYLVKDLSDQERSRMELWAEAMRSLNMPDTNTDLNLVLKVIEDNNSIPVIVIDDDQQITAFRNVKIREKNAADFMKAGCVGLGVGGNLVNKEWIKNGEWDRITALAQEFMNAVKQR